MNPQIESEPPTQAVLPPQPRSTTHHRHDVTGRCTSFVLPPIPLHPIVVLSMATQNLSEGGDWVKVQACFFFDANCNITIQIGCWLNLGWKRRPLWPGWVLSLCFWPIFGIASACAPSPRAYQSSFYPQNPTSILFYVADWYWIGCLNPGLEEVIFWPILAPICWICSAWNLFFWRKMTQNTHLTNRRGF